MKQDKNEQISKKGTTLVVGKNSNGKSRFSYPLETAFRW